ncbi:MAG: cyclic nucleotide-binding domain-containing protein [Rudaea sp.]
MDVFSRFRSVDFMSQLTDRDLQELARITRRQRFVAGEDIVKQGDFTDRFFIIDEGGVHFRRTDVEGFEKAVGSEGPGEYFGKQMFTSQEPSDYTVEAIGQAWLYVLQAEDFDSLVEAEPGILQRMPEVVAARRRLTRGFKWLTPGEIVVFSTHHHPLLLAQVLIAPILAAVLLLALAFALSTFGVLNAFSIQGLDVVLMALAVLIPAGWAAYAQADWRDDDFIVTNKRVIHSEKAPFLSEARREIPISRIQAITLQKTTPLQSFFGISTLDVRSAGMEAIVFDSVANGEKIRDLIERQRGALRARQQAEDRERFRKRVGSELQHYVLRVPMEEPEQRVVKYRESRMGDRMRAAWHAAFGYEFHDGKTVTYRKHLIALAMQARIPLVLIVLLLLALAVYFYMPVFALVPERGFLAAWLVLFLLALFYLAWQWEDWRNDIYMLTENSVVDIERLPFGFDSRETTALLVNIQDARTLRPGIQHAVFNYGNVEISVAGGAPPMVFRDVAHPQEIQAEIFRRLEAFRLRQRERETSMQSRNVVDALIAYHRLLMQERAGPEEQAQTTTIIEQPRLPPPPPAGRAINPPPPGTALPIPLITDSDAELSEFPPPTAFGDEP